MKLGRLEDKPFLFWPGTFSGAFAVKLTGEQPMKRYNHSSGLSFLRRLER